MDFPGCHQRQHSQYDYDPSQIQPYDHQSYQQFYGCNLPYDHQYAYFPSYGHSISDPLQAHLQFQQELTAIHPPGVPIALQPVPRRPNVPTGPSQYGGRGGWGGRSFRGGGQGRFNHQGPPRGRGRGLNGGRHFPSHSSGPTISSETYAPPSAGATSVIQIQPSSSIPGQIPSTKPAQVAAAPSQPPPHKPWCEICKVECNTPEVLEQHKNGKRHKKNLQVHEELQRCKATNGPQSGQEVPASPCNLTVQPEKVHESEKKECPTKIMGSEPTAEDHKDEIKLQNNMGETSEVPAEKPEEKPRDNSAVRGCGSKRKMRGGRGCKNMRTNDGSRRPVEAPKPKQARSFICELCNVKCESQVVYNSHLIGKRHLSNLKRSHCHQGLNGEVGLQAPYPPDINALSNSINSQIQQGVSDPQVLLAQLLMTVLSQTQVPAIAPPSGPVATQIPASISVAGSIHEPQFQNVTQIEASEITENVEIKNPAGETKDQLLSVPLELDAPTGSSMSTQSAVESSETKEKVLKFPQDGIGSTSAENPGGPNDQVPSECEASTS